LFVLFPCLTFEIRWFCEKECVKVKANPQIEILLNHKPREWVRVEAGHSEQALRVDRPPTSLSSATPISMPATQEQRWAEGSWNVIEFSETLMCWTMNALTHRISPIKVTGYLAVALGSLLLLAPAHASGNPLDRDTYRQNSNPIDRKTYRQNTNPLDRETYRQNTNPLDRKTYQQNTNPLDRETYWQNTNPLDRGTYRQGPGQPNR
jgi:hypothetical protein